MEREGDEWQTSFNEASGHYEYLDMLFVLNNAMLWSWLWSMMLSAIC
jgi:hypothetical protein